ncbi:hypothetical protein [Fodinibius sediminis]|uniref:Uncharacterized protein n=1 Tax=Fodinibius sediminis TaxID=1214077 RepID=A0A521F8J4_9BACT|nr:hypothetical protein [Fodinibius sediminis]SMO92488.1 hypothetical protein SAMN06265218_1266 [Fodinibius sediminis]
MGRDDSFFEKNKGKIGIAGLAVNALQNQQIAKRQKALAQLQAKTAQLQKEENNLKKKELKLLKKEQEVLKEESKRKEELTGELLDITPKLFQLLEKLQNSDYQSEFQRGKDLYEANCVLAYIDSRKDVIKDINFHDYLLKLDNKLTSSIQKFQKGYDVFVSYLEDMELFIDENRVTISTIGKLIINYKKGDKYDFDKLEKGLKKIRDESSRRELLLEELQHYHSVLFEDNLFTNTQYVTLPLSKRQSETVIYFLENISDKKFFEEEILFQIETLKANYKIEELAQKLEGKKIDEYTGDYAPLNFPEIRSILEKAEPYSIKAEFVDRIEKILKRYKGHIRRRLSGSPVQNKTDIEVLKYVRSITNIDSGQDLSTKIEDVENTTDLYYLLMFAVSAVPIILIIIAGFLADSGNNVNHLLTWGTLIEIVLLILFISVSFDKSDATKDIRESYEEKVNNYFKSTTKLLSNMKS